MARNIKGITIEIDGKTTQLQESLSKVNEKLKQTQSDLRDVNKLLKLDPTNTDLLKQKQGLLKSAISDVKEKLDKEKEALKQLEAADPSEKNTENMKVLQRQIADDEQQLKSLTEQSKEFGSVFKQQCEAVGEQLKDVGSKVSEVGENMTKSLTVPIVAGGTAAVAAFTEVDKAEDELIKKTGASGKELESMKSIMEDIATSIPTDFDTAAQAVGEVSTRFGLNGDELAALSEKYVKFAQLNNVDVSSAIDATQKAMAAYGIEATNAGEFLDRLNKTAQETGVDTDKLTSGLVSNATAFQEMGLSADQAVVFMGQLEKSGANSETVMNGLRKALKSATDSGLSMDTALMILSRKLQHAESDTEGLAAAYEIFGKSGDQIYGAIKAGTIDFENLATAVEDTGDSINATFEATLDPTDKLKTTFNELKATGAEVGGTILEMLAPAIEAVSGAVSSLKEWWDGLSPSMQQTILTVAGVVAAIGPLISILGGIISAVGTISTVIGLLSGPIGIVVAAIAALIAIGVLLYKNWDTIVAKAKEIKDKVVEAWGNLKQGVTDKVNAVKEGVSNAWNTMKENVTGKMDAMKSMISGKWDAIKAKYQEAGGGIKGIVSGMIEGVKQYFTLGFDTLNTLTGGKLNAVKDKFTSILGAARDKVKEIIDKIKGFFNFSWSLPHLKMPHVSISGEFSLVPPRVPKFSIEWYKKAYQNPVLFTQPTVLQTPYGAKGFGDGAGAEVVMGLNKLREMVGGSGTVTNNIVVNAAPGMDVRELADAVAERIAFTTKQSQAVFA